MSFLGPIADRFLQAAPSVDRWSLRLVDDQRESLTVRRDILQPADRVGSTGAMVTVVEGGGEGYCATCDLSPLGLERATEEARHWARSAARIGPAAPPRGSDSKGGQAYQSTVGRPWADVSLEHKISLLHEASHRLKRDARIVDWEASLQHRRQELLLLTSSGGRSAQSFHFITPELVAVANQGTDTQRRTLGGGHLGRQGGWDQLERLGFPAAAERVGEEALALLAAPDCPTGMRDLLLLPGQMILQIHESIGHPLELDRILGDERNYAGGSFVTREMFGSYRYGSELLDITFDPTRGEELASYACDDEGTRAERQYLIRAGILERPLGGASSQARAGLPGVANARACSWNRPPIDRMANLNLEPGHSSLAELIGSIERGVLMETNRSWSIDDSRNKFQFGCEYARLVEDGELRGVVRNPNYRGLSATFWRNLAGVGDESTFQVMGVGTCGKGEPNQMIHVGHAAPACVFREVEVFGGAAA